MESLAVYILKKTPGLLVSWFFKKIYGKKDVEIFKKYVEMGSKKWKKVLHGEPEKWIYADDNSFVIEVHNIEDSYFEESWSKKFPDKNSYKYKVSLKINSELVECDIFYIALDGYRYFVPLPKIGEAFGEYYFYYDRKSVEYKLFKIIGRKETWFESLDDFAKHCGVKVV